jgi:DNA-binding beta-propeller fold protein YncE
LCPFTLRRAGSPWEPPNGQFNNPVGLAIDQIDWSLYVADSGNNRVQKLDLVSQRW